MSRVKLAITDDLFNTILFDLKKFLSIAIFEEEVGLRHSMHNSYLAAPGSILGIPIPIFPSNIYRVAMLGQ